MNRRQRFSGLAALLGMILLILDGKTAVAGAQEGITLCLKTVIPSLFPFFILSAVVIQSGNVPGLGGIRRLFGLPEGMEPILIPGLLGGYPVGAQSVFQTYQSGNLTKPEAERMLAFCSNAGPAFLFGMVGQMFPKRWMAWALWGIHIVGAVAAAHCFSGSASAVSPGIRQRKPQKDILNGSVVTMGTVCGWIVLFRVIIAFLDRWMLWLFSQELRVAIIGLLELSNGCWELTRVVSVPMRFILCSGMLAAGGVCVTMQTASVTGDLSLRCYALGKLVQLVVSLVLSSCIAFQTALPLLWLLPFFLLRKMKNRGSNRVLSGV